MTNFYKSNQLDQLAWLVLLRESAELSEDLTLK